MWKHDHSHQCQVSVYLVTYVNHTDINEQIPNHTIMYRIINVHGRAFFCSIQPFGGNVQRAKTDSYPKRCASSPAHPRQPRDHKDSMHGYPNPSIHKVLLVRFHKSVGILLGQRPCGTIPMFGNSYRPGA